MPQRNEIYGWEVAQAMRTRQRQAQARIIKTSIWWLIVIAIGLCAGLAIRLMQGWM
jgi:hypothetical protein